MEQVCLWIDKLKTGFFFRLNNLILTYNLPPQWLTFLKQMKAFISGQNVFILTIYSGYNPDSESLLLNTIKVGVYFYGKPSIRTCKLRLSIQL